MNATQSFSWTARRALLSSVAASALATTAFVAMTGPARAEFDRFVLVQPIVVCDDAGNNCAPVNTYWAGTAHTLEQAGVLPIFLPLSQFNNSALLASNSGPSDFDEGDGGSTDGLTINMWFTGLNSIVDCGGEAAIGCATTPGREIVIDAQSLANEAAGNGNDPYHRTIAHEMGHSFSLPHVSGAGFVGNLLEVPATVDRSATYDEIGVTRFLLNDDQIDDIRGDGKAQSASDCNGTGGVNLITLNATEACLNIFAQGDNDIVVLSAGSGVLQDIQGEGGNDTIFVLNGAIVGANVSGGDNDDAITIGGIVLLNVTGDAGNDTIDALASAQIIGDVDGGAGIDTITVASDPANIFGGIGVDTISLFAGGVVTQSIFGDDGDGDEGDGDAADTILIAGGSVGVSVFGEGGADSITMVAGSIGDVVSGAGGADVITIVNGSVGNDVLGGAGADLITVLGGTVSDSVQGEGDADTILLAGGSIGGAVSGGAGGDTITLNGATVTGVIGGNEGDDFIDVLSGSAAGVAGDDNNDRIRILGGTVNGNVTGGGGNDALSLFEPGVVTGFVDGGAATDTIVIAADPTNVFGGIGSDTIDIDALALVTSNVFGDDGNGNEADGDALDVINLDGGTVGGFVDGEGGADTINLRGTAVTGNLFGGGGGDTFNISGGITSGIRGEDGGDVAVWTGGIITTDIAMGVGSDRLDVVGPNFGGTANQAALTLMDGGDNASSADGQVDVLNLIGVRAAVGVPVLLAPVQNWEHIFVQSNSLLTLGGASRTIDGELFSIDASSAVFATGAATFNFGGQLQNLGDLDLRDGAANSVLDAAAQYSGGPGSTFFVDIELGGPGSLSDELRAASSAGATGISVVDVLGGLGGFNPDGIVVVRTDAGGSDATHFELNGGPIDKGLFFYDLLFADSTLANVVTAGVAEDQHLLVGIPDVEVFQLGRIAAQAQWAWQRSTGVWRDRTADLREYGGGKGLVDAKLQPGVWGRVFGADGERDDVAQFSLFDSTYAFDTSYDLGIRGFAAGADWVADGVLNNGTALFGAFVGHSSFDAHFDGNGVDPAPKMLGDGFLVGAYATYLKGGLYVDALVKADFPELTLTFASLAPSQVTDAVDARSVGGVVDVGYRSFHTLGFYTEVLGTISYASTRIDDALLGGSIIEFGDNDSLRGRAGLGLGGKLYEFEGHAIAARLEASAWHEFDADNETRILSLGPAFTLNDDAGGTYGELSGQLNAFGVTGGPSSFLKVDYRFNDGYQDMGLSLGLRVPLGG